MVFLQTVPLSAHIFLPCRQKRFDGQVRKAMWLDYWRRLMRKRRDLVKFDDIARYCGKNLRRMPQIIPVPIRQIVGSVGRTKDFTCDLLPRPCVNSHRWGSIEQAMETGIGLPPVELYRIGDVYFIIDGHHRSSVAHANGSPTIDAQVMMLEGSKWLTVEDFCDENWIKNITLVQGGNYVYTT
jgi:hypothetical protein